MCEIARGRLQKCPAPHTITHLKGQRVEGDLNWEVLVIDNASTDNTALVARQCCGDHGLIPLRLVQEIDSVCLMRASVLWMRLAMT